MEKGEREVREREERERERERRGREKNVFYSFAHRANRRLLVYIINCVVSVRPSIHPSANLFMS